MLRSTFVFSRPASACWGEHRRSPQIIITLLALLTCVFSHSGESLAQNITTVVGGGPAGGTAHSAFIAYPGGVVKDNAGNTYISSNWGHYVYKLNTTGTVSVVAGKGYAGFSGDGGLATKAALNSPAGLAIDKAGNLYIVDTGNNRVRRVSAATGKIKTIAGNSPVNMYFLGGYGGDGGPATKALLNSPYTVALDGQGNLFISDYRNFRIRRVDGKTGIISTVVGNGTGGYNGDSIPATGAEIFYAITVIADKSGNLYIADSGNNRIRKVDAKTQIITTVAGNGTGGFGGDGGLATQAELSFPNAVARDSAGNLSIVDTGNNRVREVNAKTQIIKTSVGTGVAGFGGDGGPAVAAEITDSSGDYIDTAGNLLIADSGNQRVRIVDTKGIINTLAGGGSAGDKGSAKKALLSYPVAVAIDGADNLFIVEGGTPVVRKVTAKGTISTVAGSGSEGFSGDGGPAVKADFYGPAGIAVDTAGDIFIADAFNARVRRVDHLTRKVSTFAGNGLGCTAPPCGDGGLAVNANITAPGSLAVDSSGNLYIADPYDAVVRRVDATTNIITTVAGDYVTCSAPTSPCGDGGLAISANLRLPFGVAVDASGDIFIADSGDNRVRVVDGKTGVISPKAFTGQYNFSGDGGSALQATMARPLTLALDSANNLFISGGYDVDFSLGAGLEVVRRVDAASGIVTLVAGQEANPTLYGFGGDGGLASQATLNNLGIAVDSVGNLYIADAGNDRIRKVSP